MKFVRFDSGRTGLVVAVEGDRVLDVLVGAERLAARDPAAAAAIAGVLTDADGQDWTRMIGRWDDVRDGFGALVGLAESGRDAGLPLRPLADVVLAPPLASPASHIFALGSNTTAHIIRAMKAMLDLDLDEEQALRAKTEGQPPFGFTVWPSTVVGQGAAVAPPRGTLKFDYEGECVVYVKTGGRYLETVDLWGYAAFNDLAVRDTHLKLAGQADWGPFSLNTPKNFDTGKACGPWVAVDEGGDLAGLRCVVTVNGDVRQDWGLDEMIYGFDETLAFLSQSMTLRPGDMLASGTGAGVAIEKGIDGPDWLRPGDIVEVRLDGAGTLRNVVGAW